MDPAGGEKTNGVPHDDLYWLGEMLKAVPYGEVGLVYTLHGGRIVNTRYALETKSKAGHETGPPVVTAAKVY